MKNLKTLIKTKGKTDPRFYDFLQGKYLTFQSRPSWYFTCKPQLVGEENLNAITSLLSNWKYW